ncbi:hypothetical protein COV16_01160, partial [Candidatus Woesearchaeota archaeon CG10_big_fil_rev_8_21_14_0_10_34_8]
MIELVFDRDDFDRRRDGLVARVLEGDTNKIKFDSNGMLATLYNEVKRRDHVVIDVPGRPYGNMVAGGLAGFLIGCWVDMYLPIFPVAGAVVGVLAGYFKPISTEEPVDLDVFYRHAKQELHQDEEVFQEKMADGCTY